jgi:hypothetical protein
MMYTKSELRELPTLAQGQCCDLKAEENGRRYWICRMGGGVTVEKLIKGRWTIVAGACTQGE